MDAFPAHSAPRRRPIALALLVVTLAGLFLRTWRTDVPFHSGDFASIPYLVSQTWSPHCVLGHIHGPLLPAMDLLFARLVTALGQPMTEAMWRLPLGLVGTLHIVVTYLLMRRLRAGPWIAVLAAGLTAGLPSLTSDARFPWGYETLAVCVGSLTLWAWLRELDQPTRYGPWLAGGLLGLYLASHLVIHAVPIVVVAVCVLSLGWRGALRRLTRASTLLPVIAAAIIPFVAYVRFGGGILGRMARHVGEGTLSSHATPLRDIAGWWVNHVGLPWSLWCAAGVIAGLMLLARGDRRGLPAVWTVVFIAPFLLCIDASKIGRPTTYQIQGTYAATLAGCVLIHLLSRMLARVRQTHGSQSVGVPPRNKPSVAFARLSLTAFAGLMLATQFLGSASNLFTSRRWPTWTGTVEYGRAAADPGYKAAGWYVRQHVRADAVVFATHGITGMEYPCAAYYLGRHVAAAEDTTEPQERRLILAVRDRVDVAIVEPRYADFFTKADGFAPAATIHCDGRPILFVVARVGVKAPAMQLDVREADAAFDRECRLTRVPTIIASNPRTAAVNREIHRVLAAAGHDDAALAVAP